MDSDNKQQEEQILVKFPENGASVSSNKIEDRVNRMDDVIKGIIFVSLMSVIAIIIAVIGIFLDQLRFNSLVVSEYSDRKAVIEDLQKTNKELLEQNKQNQERIIQLLNSSKDKQD